MGGLSCARQRCVHATFLPFIPPPLSTFSPLPASPSSTDRPGHGAAGRCRPRAGRPPRPGAPVPGAAAGRLAAAQPPPAGRHAGGPGQRQPGLQHGTQRAGGRRGQRGGGGGVPRGGRRAGAVLRVAGGWGGRRGGGGSVRRARDAVGAVLRMAGRVRHWPSGMVRRFEGKEELHVLRRAAGGGGKRGPNWLLRKRCTYRQLAIWWPQGRTWNCGQIDACARGRQPQ